MDSTFKPMRSASRGFLALSLLLLSSVAGRGSASVAPPSAAPALRVSAAARREAAIDSSVGVVPNAPGPNAAASPAAGSSSGQLGNTSTPAIAPLALTFPTSAAPPGIPPLIASQAIVSQPQQLPSPAVQPVPPVRGIVVADGLTPFQLSDFSRLFLPPVPPADAKPTLAGDTARPTAPQAAAVASPTTVAPEASTPAAVASPVSEAAPGDSGEPEGGGPAGDLGGEVGEGADSDGASSEPDQVDATSPASAAAAAADAADAEAEAALADAAAARLVAPPASAVTPVDGVNSTAVAQAPPLLDVDYTMSEGGNSSSTSSVPDMVPVAEEPDSTPPAPATAAAAEPDTAPVVAGTPKRPLPAAPAEADPVALPVPPPLPPPGPLLVQQRPRKRRHGDEMLLESDVLLEPPDDLPRPGPRPNPSSFVTRQGAQLLLEGKPFYFVGFNAVWMVGEASWGHEWGRKQVLKLMQSSQRLGMRVGRCWAFNSKMPNGPGPVYDESQFEGLDFIVYAAGRVGLRLVLALGNLWPAYRGPEDFYFWATGATGNATVVDFYRDARTRALYKAHMQAIVTRVNTFTGVAYRDDPTIMGWDVLNEPRCPGCVEKEDIRAYMEWLAEMTAALQHFDHNHLVALGTEGFFVEDSVNHLENYNPGAGAQCEGENWPMMGQLSGVDFTTMHVYERHMERIPRVATWDRKGRHIDWTFCDFDCYINWLVRYLDVHTQISGTSMGKPLVIEEFGLTWWRIPEDKRRVLLQVVFEMLVRSAREGGALAGAMFWNAALSDITKDQDGYNVYVDHIPKALQGHHDRRLRVADPPASAAPPHAAMTTHGRHTLQLSAVAVPVAANASGAALGNRGAVAAGAGAAGGKRSGNSAPLHSAAADSAALTASGGDTTRRKLLKQTGLDGFRRRMPRRECARRASKTWRPPVAEPTIDVKEYQRKTGHLDAVDIIYAATQQLEKAESKSG